MKIKIEEIKVVTEIFEKNVDFPYFGWWSNKKDEIIKIFLEYNDDETIINGVKCVVIKNGWNINSSITSNNIHVHDNIIDNDIDILLRDYHVIATEKEYNDFREIAINKLSV